MVTFSVSVTGVVILKMSADLHLGQCILQEIDVRLSNLASKMLTV